MSTRRTVPCVLDFKEVLTDLLGIIAVGLADKPDGIRQQDVALRFLRFVFLPLFVFLICDLLHGGYLAKRDSVFFLGSFPL